MLNQAEFFNDGCHPNPLVFSGFSWGVGLGVGEHGGPINEGNYVVYSGRGYRTLVL